MSSKFKRAAEYIPLVPVVLDLVSLFREWRRKRRAPANTAQRIRDAAAKAEDVTRRVRKK